MKFKHNEELGAASDFWKLLDGGYLEPIDLCSNEDTAGEIKYAIEQLEDYRDALIKAGILNWDL